MIILNPLTAKESKLLNKLHILRHIISRKLRQPKRHQHPLIFLITALLSHNVNFPNLDKNVSRLLSGIISLASHNHLPKHRLAIQDDGFDVFASVGSDGNGREFGDGCDGCDEFVAFGAGRGGYEHEWKLFHEDGELDECGWDGEGADVVLDDGFAVEVKDTGDFAFGDCFVLGIYLAFEFGVRGILLVTFGRLLQTRCWILSSCRR